MSEQPFRRELLEGRLKGKALDLLSQNKSAIGDESDEVENLLADVDPITLAVTESSLILEVMVLLLLGGALEKEVCQSLNPYTLEDLVAVVVLRAKVASLTR